MRAAIAALLLVFTLVTPVEAKKLTVTISGPVAGEYAVTQSGAKNPWLLWVAQKCDGTAQYLPVRWSDTAGTVGVAGPFDSGTGCSAYVWRFPDSEDPL